MMPTPRSILAPLEGSNIAEAAGGVKSYLEARLAGLPPGKGLPRPLDWVLPARAGGRHPDLVDILPDHDVDEFRGISSSSQ